MAETVRAITDRMAPAVEYGVHRNGQFVLNCQFKC